jgi:hypothetical protein
VKQLPPPRKIYSRTANIDISYKEPSSPKDSSSSRKAPAMSRKRAATVAPGFSAEDDTTWQDVLLHIDTDAVVSV